MLPVHWWTLSPRITPSGSHCTSPGAFDEWLIILDLSQRAYPLTFVGIQASPA